MSTAKAKIILALSSTFLLALALLPACQQKCQPPATTPFKHLSDTTWRAVETTDPRVTITKFDFIELQFANDFSGKVIKVVQNQEFSSNPIELFTWAVPDNTQGSGPLRIQYSSPGGGDQGADGGDPNAGATPPQVYSTDTYNFNLTNQLELTETNTGYYWRFVPMVGIVAPDTSCTF